MKPKSAHKKGKRFEDYVAKEIEAEGLGKAQREIGSGSGKRKGDISANLPFLLECKNQKKIEWWKSIDQSKEQARLGNFDRNKWMLVVRDSRTSESNPDIYAIVDFWEALKLLKKDKEPKIKAPDRELRWKIERLISAAKDVLKVLIK